MRKKNQESINIDQEPKTSHKKIKAIFAIGVLGVGSYIGFNLYSRHQQDQSQVQKLEEEVQIGHELNAQGIQYNKIGINGGNNFYVSVDVNGKNINFNDKITNTPHGPVDTLYLRVVGANNQQVGTTAVFNNSTTEIPVLDSFKK